MNRNLIIPLGVGLGLAGLMVVALILGGWVVSSAYAQGITGNAPWGGCHNNQAVFDLLKTNAQDLSAQRKAGKSLLDIANAKGVSEEQLLNALLQSVTTMHAWMGSNYPQFNVDQMTQYMRSQTAQDIRVTAYGTMTDFRLFTSAGGMMGGGANYGASGGMMNGWFGTNGGMMGGWNGGTGAPRGGMMGGWGR